MRRFFLLSIKPRYSDRIFAREKRYELRKRRLGIRAGDIVVVYTSSPTRALTGAFVALGELELPVGTLWSRHRAKLGIGRADYDEYFGDAESAVAIPIGKVVRIPAIPLPDLRRFRPGFTPPQSFMYCPDAIRARLPKLPW